MLNVNAIRNKVKKAIKVAPTDVTICRPNKVDDGCGGFIIPEDNPFNEITKSQGIFNNSNRSANTTVLPGGIVTNFKPNTLLLVWEPGIEYKVGDFFMLNGVKYTVTNPVNVSNLNIIWQLELSSVDEEEQ